MVYMVKPGGQGVMGESTTPPAPDFVIQVPASQLPLDNIVLVPEHQPGGGGGGPGSGSAPGERGAPRGVVDGSPHAYGGREDAGASLTIAPVSGNGYEGTVPRWPYDPDDEHPLDPPSWWRNHLAEDTYWGKVVRGWIDRLRRSLEDLDVPFAIRTMESKRDVLVDHLADVAKYLEAVSWGSTEDTKFELDAAARRFLGCEDDLGKLFDKLYKMGKAALDRRAREAERAWIEQHSGDPHMQWLGKMANAAGYRQALKQLDGARARVEAATR